MVEEGRGGVETVQATLEGEEKRRGQVEKEMEGVVRQIEAHKAEYVKRQRRKGERDMHLEEGPLVGTADSGEEVGVQEEAGKRRKVAGRRGRPAGVLDLPTLIGALRILSEKDRDWCMRKVGNGGVSSLSEAPAEEGSAIRDAGEGKLFSHVFTPNFLVAQEKVDKGFQIVE